MFQAESVERVYSQLKNYINFTPCIYSSWLSKICDAEIYLKLENMQHTGSFKERGALSALLKNDSQVKPEIICASAGNHAQAVALHAKRLGLKATIFMPIGTSNTKILQTEKYEAEVRLAGNNYDEAYKCAMDYCEQTGGKYLHAYNDLDVIIGQATVGLEIVRQVEMPDFVVVPVGGGGLLAGIGQYISSLPNFSGQIVGVGALGYANNSSLKTIADGIAVKQMGELSRKICEKIAPLMVKVGDKQIQDAMMLLLEKQKIITEGAGASGVAALFDDYLSKKVKNKKVVVVISGGNIDISLLARLTGQQLIKTGRLCRMSIVIKDTPGSLEQLLTLVRLCSGNVVDIHHERFFASLKWNEVLVDLTIETKDESYEEKLVALVKDNGYELQTLKMGNDFVC